jgi:hypothetical protein
VGLPHACLMRFDWLQSPFLLHCDKCDCAVCFFSAFQRPSLLQVAPSCRSHISTLPALCNRSRHASIAHLRAIGESACDYALNLKTTTQRQAL